jgi:hypothetical protein
MLGTVLRNEVAGKPGDIIAEGHLVCLRGPE